MEIRSQEHADVIEAQERIDEAKASLSEHVDELGRRLRALRHKLDIRVYIRRYPLPALGIASVLGAGLGFVGGKQRPRQPDDSDKRKTSGEMALAAAGALLIKLIREAAFRQISESVKQWWETRHPPAAQPAPDVQRDS